MHVFLLAFWKKVEKMAKEKGCDLIGDWKKSLMNQLYWCATSTSDGKGEMTSAKRTLVDNHIHNKHKGHGKKLWIWLSTDVHFALQCVVPS